MSAYDTCESKTSYTRGVETPDGGHQVVTMEGWYWNAAEWLAAEKNWPLERFVKLAWKTAKQMENDGTMTYDNFRTEFAAGLQEGIRYIAALHIARGSGINDNK
jgi:hypothetical protein